MTRPFAAERKTAPQVGGCRPKQYEVKTRRGVRAAAETSFRFGIEEEYFLCDAATLQPAMSTPESLFTRREPGSAARLNREMLQAQVEVATRPHARSGD